MAFPERLLTAHTDLEALFEDLHAANVEAHQLNPHLREAVSALSAAVAAVERAHKHVFALAQTAADDEKARAK